MLSAVRGSPVTGRPASGLTSTMLAAPRRRIVSPIAPTSRMAPTMSARRAARRWPARPRRPDEEGIDRSSAIEVFEIIGERRRALSREAEGLDQGAALLAILGRPIEGISASAADQAQPHPGPGIGARQRTPIASDTPAITTVRRGARARRPSGEIHGAERRQRVGPPLEPSDNAVDRAILRVALVIPALDLRRSGQGAQERHHQPGVRGLRIVPEGVERSLAGQPGDVEDRIAQRLHRNALMQGGDADRAVDRDDPGGVAQELGRGAAERSASTRSATPKRRASRATNRLQPISPLSSG